METVCIKNFTEILENKEALKNNGQCSSIYTDKDKNYIIKEIEITRYQTYNDIFKEIEIQQDAYSLGVAPQLHCYKVETKKVYIIMEKLTEFIDLTTVYNDKKEDEELKKKIAKTITILYQKGIYHLDLHSDNIFIKNDNEVKIIDYGISEFFREGEGSDKNTVRKKPYIHRVIEIIGSDYYLDLTKYIDNDGNYIDNDGNYIDNNKTTTQGGKTRKQQKTRRNKKKRKTKNKTTNYKRKTIKRVKRVKRKQI